MPRVDRYPSRVGGHPAILERLDPVVFGDDGPLDPELLAAFEDDGFLVLPKLFDAQEVESLNAALDQLATDPDVRGLVQAVIEPDSDALRSIFEVHAVSEAFRDLIADPRLTGIARQLLGGDVYVHQSRVNLKPGYRGREFYWHSDFETWHCEDGMPAMRAVSCSISLTDNHPWNGPLLVIAGSHRSYVQCVGATPPNHHERSLRRQESGIPDDASLAALVEAGRIEHVVGPAGSVVFFDSNLMHGSNGNITPLARRNAFVVYNSVDNALDRPFAAPAPRPEHIAARTVRPLA